MFESLRRQKNDANYVDKSGNSMGDVGIDRGGLSHLLKRQFELQNDLQDQDLNNGSLKANK